MSLIDLIRKGPIASANANFANAAIPQVENDAGLARLATLALAKAATDRGKERDTNRAQFPFTSEKLDDLRAHFGNGVRVAYAKEGEREIGSPLASQELGVPFSKLARGSPG